MKTIIVHFKSLVYIAIIVLLTGCDPSVNKVLQVTDYKYTNEQKLYPLDLVLDINSIEKNHLAKNKKDQHQAAHYAQTTPVFINDALKLYPNDITKNLLKDINDETYGYMTCQMTYSKDSSWEVGYFIVSMLTCFVSSSFGIPIGSTKSEHSYDFIIYDCLDKEIAKYTIKASTKDNKGLYDRIDTRANQIETLKKCLKKFFQTISTDSKWINDSLMQAKLYLTSERAKCSMALSEQNKEFDSISNLFDSGERLSLLPRLNKFIDKNAYYSTAYFLRALIYYNDKNYVSALQDYNMCCKLNPSDLGQNIYLYKSMLLDEMGRNNDALIAVNKAIERILIKWILIN